MSIIGWLILGLIAGFIANEVVNKAGRGVVLDIVVGIVGAVAGGFLFSTIGGTPVTGLNVYSLFVAFIGAIVVLVLYHAITGRRHRPPAGRRTRMQARCGKISKMPSPCRCSSRADELVLALTPSRRASETVATMSHLAQIGPRAGG
jgi:uncharacterized membrane protein YeaQ/YmgE (transglycosylase-associated protein family)